MSLAPSLCFTLAACVLTAALPTTVADDTCLPGPVCAHNALQDDRPDCDDGGAEAWHTGVSIGSRPALVLAGWWQSCSEGASQSSEYERIGAWIRGGSVDVGYNQYSTDDASQSTDLYVVHAGVPAAWYYEQHGQDGSFCMLNVRVFLSVGAGTQTPCVSEHAPGLLP